MSYFIWLPAVALAGWVSGQAAGSRAFGRVADVLLGISGGFAVRFVVEQAIGATEPVYLLLFSMWGAAAGPAMTRYLLRRRQKFSPKFDETATPSLR
jgi:uncharacterized membrane protein YeaQ/YmgE (transglycosylase-associated protein family)